MNAYEHTQKAPLHWLLYPPGLFLVAGAWLNRGQIPLVLLMLAVAALLRHAGPQFPTVDDPR